MRVLAMKLQTLLGKIACVLLLASAAMAAQKTRAVRTTSPAYRVLKTSGDISDFAFSRDGKTLITANSGWPGKVDFTSEDDHRSTITIWNAKTWKAKRRIKLHSSVDDMALSPDGKTLATYNSKYSTNSEIFDPVTRRYTSQLYTLRIWNVASGRLLHTFARTDYDNGLCFSGDGLVLASVNRGGVTNEAYIELYNTHTWKLYRRLREIEGGFIDIDISPNHHWVAASSRAAEASLDELSIWDTNTGNRIRHFKIDWEDYTDNETLKNSALANLPLGKPTFLYDNKTLVAGNILYRFASPTKIRPLLHGTQKHTWDNAAVYSGRTTKVAFDSQRPDTKIIEVWRLNPQSLIFKTRSSASSAYDPVKFSDDGRSIAAADGKTLNIWRIP